MIFSLSSLKEDLFELKYYYYLIMALVLVLVLVMVPVLFGSRSNHKSSSQIPLPSKPYLGPYCKFEVTVYLL